MAKAWKTATQDSTRTLVIRHAALTFTGSESHLLESIFSSWSKHLSAMSASPSLK